MHATRILCYTTESLLHLYSIRLNHSQIQILHKKVTSEGIEQILFMCQIETGYTKSGLSGARITKRAYFLDFSSSRYSTLSLPTNEVAVGATFSRNSVPTISSLKFYQ